MGRGVVGWVRAGECAGVCAGVDVEAGGGLGVEGGREGREMRVCVGGGVGGAAGGEGSGALGVSVAGDSEGAAAGGEGSMQDGLGNAAELRRCCGAMGVAMGVGDHLVAVRVAMVGMGCGD